MYRKYLQQERGLHMNTTLVIMAAGIGSRFGTGIKQLAKMNANGEIIMDYSVYDAKAAGFNKVVFVIRRDIEKEFKEVIGDRISQFIDVAYVYQELTNLPEGFTVPEGRTKPWGTGQAVLACKDVVKEPFVIINADDYYGKEAFVKLRDFLISHQPDEKKHTMALAGFVLEHTLSENGTVTRGICEVDGDGFLTRIVETSGIQVVDGVLTCANDKMQQTLSMRANVSMNMWAAYPDFLEYLDNGFSDFLQGISDNPLKKEYLIPTIVGDMLTKDEVSVQVLETSDHWIGITYREDIAKAQEGFARMTADGTYPQKLWG